MTTTTAADRQEWETFQWARAEYDGGRYREAERAFRSLADSSVIGTEALYFAGMSRLALGDLGAARQDFLAVLKQRPEHVDSLYQLGCISGVQNDLITAQSYFEAVMRTNPKHRDAAVKLQWARSGGPPRESQLRTHPPVEQNDSLRDQPLTGADLRDLRSAPLASSSPTKEPGTTQYGVYEALLRSEDPMCSNIINLLDRIKVERRPRLSAFLDRIAGQCLIGLLIVYIVLQLIQSTSYWFGTSDDPTLPLDGEVIAIWALVALAVMLWELLNVKSSVYRISRGRAQVARGVLIRRWRSVELYRVVEVRIDRSFLQLFTNDASLILVTERETLELEGLGPYREMEELAQRLLNLVFYLRTNGLVRGIIS